MIYYKAIGLRIATLRRMRGSTSTRLRGKLEQLQKLAEGKRPAHQHRTVHQGLQGIPMHH